MLKQVVAKWPGCIGAVSHSTLNKWLEHLLSVGIRALITVRVVDLLGHRMVSSY